VSSLIAFSFFDRCVNPSRSTLSAAGEGTKLRLKDSVRRAGWEGLLSAYQNREGPAKAGPLLELCEVSDSPRNSYSDSTNSGSR
jgi:hypothetical protein